MKMFDYDCTECGFTFTFLQKNHERVYNPSKCPECGKTKPVRLMPVFHTKSHYGPNHPRHRRGMGRPSIPKNHPVYSKEDLK